MSDVNVRILLPVKEGKGAVLVDIKIPIYPPCLGFLSTLRPHYTTNCQVL